jgi:hypothetical protein
MKVGKYAYNLHMETTQGINQMNTQEVFTINNGEAHGDGKTWNRETGLAEGYTWTKDSANYILNETSKTFNGLSHEEAQDHTADISEVSVGDVVVIFSRGMFRTAIVNKVAKTKITAGFTTQGAVDGMKTKIATPDKWVWISTLVQDGGAHHPNVTNKATNEFWVI